MNTVAPVYTVARLMADLAPLPPEAPVLFGKKLNGLYPVMRVELVEESVAIVRYDKAEHLRELDRGHGTPVLTVADLIAVLAALPMRAAVVLDAEEGQCPAMRVNWVPGNGRRHAARQGNVEELYSFVTPARAMAYITCALQEVVCR